MLRYKISNQKMKSRNTQAKTEVVNLISESQHALSHTEIQQKLNGLCDRVTIYRILERLLSEGFVHKIVGLDGVFRYAKCQSSCQNKAHQHDHLHFSCEACKQVICLEDVKLSYQLPEGYLVKESSFNVLGICSKCKEM